MKRKHIWINITFIYFQVSFITKENTRHFIEIRFDSYGTERRDILKLCTKISLFLA